MRELDEAIAVLTSPSYGNVTLLAPRKGRRGLSSLLTDSATLRTTMIADGQGRRRFVLRFRAQRHLGLDRVIEGKASFSSTVQTFLSRKAIEVLNRDGWTMTRMFSWTFYISDTPVPGRLINLQQIPHGNKS